MSRVDARHYMDASASRVPQAHLVETALGRHLFVADGSRLFGVEAGLFGELGAAIAGGPQTVEDVLKRIGFDGPPLIDDKPLVAPDTHALSLAVAVVGLCERNDMELTVKEVRAMACEPYTQHS